MSEMLKLLKAVYVDTLPWFGIFVLLWGTCIVVARALGRLLPYAVICLPTRLYVDAVLLSLKSTDYSVDSGEGSPVVQVSIDKVATQISQLERWLNALIFPHAPRADLARLDLIKVTLSSRIPTNARERALPFVHNQLTRLYLAYYGLLAQSENRAAKEAGEMVLSDPQAYTKSSRRNQVAA